MFIKHFILEHITGRIFLTMIFLCSMSTGNCASIQAGGTTPVGGGLTLLLGLSLAYTIKQYHASLGKGDEI